jgi:hypothetical protein
MGEDNENRADQRKGNDIVSMVCICLIGACILLFLANWTVGNVTVPFIGK